MNYLSFVAVIVLSLQGFASEPKVDWGMCSKEISESCTKKGDHETHECLEKLPKDKVSKECADFNHKLESKFSGKHKKSHKYQDI